jgi:hypothetical protein
MEVQKITPGGTEAEKPDPLYYRARRQPCVGHSTECAQQLKLQAIVFSSHRSDACQTDLGIKQPSNFGGIESELAALDNVIPETTVSSQVAHSANKFWASTLTQGFQFLWFCDRPANNERIRKSRRATG